MRSIFKLSDYEEYLKFLKEKGYIVCDFKEFEKKYNNNLELPEKIIVLRHDIHRRDISCAYKMIELEQKYFGKNVATYFVQWNFIGSTDYEKNYELDGAKEYDKFIFHCIENNIHVAPHISVFCNSYLKLYNRNKNHADLSFLNEKYSMNLKDLSGTNILNTSLNFMNYNLFRIDKTNSLCISCEKPTTKDSMNRLIENVDIYLKKYKDDWENKFKINAEIFSVHGDGIILTQKLNPNYFGSLKIFENTMLNVNSPNKYMCQPSTYKLYYKNDNSVNIDIIKNSFYDEKNTQCQVLVHPFLWYSL